MDTTLILLIIFPVFFLGFGLGFFLFKRKLRAPTANEKDAAPVEEMIQSKLKSMAEMASGIAHEINNPLAIIDGNAIKIKKEIQKSKPNSETILKSALKVERTADRIVKIISGLRSFARDSEGEPFEQADIHTIIKESLVFCQEKLRDNGVRLTVSQIPGPVMLECRPVQISQVILNLINNAYDAVSSRREKKIEIEVDHDRQFINITITDNGPGIPDHLRNQIFLPFFSTKDPGRGIGLGLSICRGIIESHGGQIILDPIKEGTRFIVKIPKTAPVGQKVA